MKKKQTPIEWLEEQIKNDIMCDHINGTQYWDKETILELIEKAKEKDKKKNYHREGCEL